MLSRKEHQQEVLTFLQKHFSTREWTFSIPHGSGTETYFAYGNGQHYFVKVGAPVERYLAMAQIDLTPPILVHRQLENGTSIMVQPFIEGKSPSRLDYRSRLRHVAEIVGKMHHHPRIKESLPAAPSSLYKDVGLLALTRLRQKWRSYREQVPSVAEFVDDALGEIESHVNQFTGKGLVASHGDICNANWLFTSDGKIYIVDLESMCMDDPAADMGALLWWYYPPELRQHFLEIAGYSYNEDFKFRMRVRMVIHCLHIILPRENSFDPFDPERFGEWLEDFRAVMNGEENPQGYD
ncbi:MAG: aminoglycoside phosphotransferase family protein [Anaerolineales bacterium]